MHPRTRRSRGTAIGNRKVTHIHPTIPPSSTTRRKGISMVEIFGIRATGTYLQNPAAEQAQDPPIDPNEMGLPDTACVVHRLSQNPYKSFFELVWGSQSFAIKWPSDVDEVCSRPGPARANDPLRPAK